ncbi:MAG TPA: TetR/AcrR family transcriptional regulator [Ktedonobacteraceae bacterium]
MPRTEESNQRIREEQKRKIILAATRVFAYKGLAATKMADIAKEAGISYGLLYHYFDTKELIFKATVERGTQGFDRLIARLQGQPGSPWERIYQLTTLILEGMRRVPEGFLVANQAFVNSEVPAEIRNLAREQSLQSFDVFLELIIEGQKAGQVVEGNPRELTQLYFSCIGGIAQNLAYVGIPDEDFPRVDTLLRILKP